MLDGKVAIVTGGATGLGRCHALELARLGARVVVNDLGVAADGSGKNESAARAVCDEIKSLGGEAVPHFGDVADWNASKGMFDTARLRVRRRQRRRLQRRLPARRDPVQHDREGLRRRHSRAPEGPLLRAAPRHRPTGASAPRPAGAVYGRIISTSSESAFFAPPGQPNYSAAKAGIVALTMGAAQLMQKYGITANVIMPRARTRMNDAGPLAAMFKKPEDGFDTFAPENVSPLVGWLASPLAHNVSGQVFVIWAKKVTLATAPHLDTRFESDARWTVDSLRRSSARTSRSSNR